MVGRRLDSSLLSGGTGLYGAVEHVGTIKHRNVPVAAATHPEVESTVLTFFKRVVSPSILGLD